MKLKTLLLLIVSLVVSPIASATKWISDAADTDSTFEKRTVIQPDDYSGKVVSTIIRKLASSPTDRGVIYIHGFNDYFFNTEMADEFISHGYDFYAVDLRKYGRSLLPGQKRYQVRSLDEYFPDIDSAIVAMKQEGITEIVMMGHSTGGLIAAYYMMKAKGAADVDALILNSPFLDWNLGNKEWLVPAVAALGRWFPGIKVPQGKSTVYAESLLASHHGRWDYDTSKKLSESPDVDAGWVRAIDTAQKALRDGKADIRVPILLMYSSESVGGDKWTEADNNGDSVLDVNDIRRYGSRLGPDVTYLKVMNGLHDLTLSRKSVTIPLYRHIFSWLSTALPEQIPLPEAA